MVPSKFQQRPRGRSASIPILRSFPDRSDPRFLCKVRVIKAMAQILITEEIDSPIQIII